MVDSVSAALGIYAASFAIAIVSGAFPLVNAEIYLVGVVVATPIDVPHAIALGVIVGCGQMVSQSMVFKAAHGVVTLGGRRRQNFEERLERARERVAKWGNKRLLILSSAATFGLPPFLLVAAAAGVLEIKFRTFVVVGVIGRSVRFATIGVIAALA